MAITDINISDTLETSAPSIRYTGDEGPKSPEEQQQMMMAQLEEEYAKYVFEMEEQGLQPISLQQFIEQTMAEGQMSSANPLPNRQMAAYGGIMDTDSGRRAYGWGSKLKSAFKSVTKPFKKVLGSDAGKAALLGAGIFGLGGGFGMPGKGWGFKPSQFSMKNFLPMLRGTAPTAAGSSAGPFKYLQKGIQQYIPGTKGLLGAYGKLSPLKALGLASAIPFTGLGMGEEVEKLPAGDMISQSFDIDYGEMRKAIAEAAQRGASETELLEILESYGVTPSSIDWETIRKGSAAGGRAGYYAGGQSTPSDYTMEDARMMTTQDKLGGITDVMKQADLYRQGSVGQMYAADGGRIKYADGRAGYPPVTMGQAPQAPQANQMAGAPSPTPMPAPQPNQMAMARGMNPMARGMNPMGGGMNPMGGRRMAQEGGRIGFESGTDLRNKMSELLIKLANGTITDEEIIELRNIESASGFSTAQGNAQGGRIGAQEGGLMDLGGMEKDYRQEGGFVPLGGEEKADDVPARLSKNEFVFTADAVRAAGGGDIDKGAGIMENVMENLEQGGRISEESQGLSGAQEMFDVSERLSEVV